MRKSRTVVVLVCVALATVLVLTMSGCGKSKKKKHHSSSAGTTTSQQSFADCAAAWKAGKAPLKSKDPGFTVTLDRLDGKEDGVACAVRPTATR